MDLIPQIVASAGSGVALLVASVWALVHIIKTFKENSSAKVTDIETITRSALDSLKQERDRVNELYARIDALANENHVLRSQLDEQGRKHAAEIKELKFEISRLGGNVQ